jgi:hypothetical protein
MSHENQQFSGLTKRVNLLADLVLQNRIAGALDVLLDAIALDPAWRVERVHAEAQLLDLEALVGDDPLDRRALEHAVLEGAVVFELRHRQLAAHAPHVEHEGIGVEHRVLVR